MLFSDVVGQEDLKKELKKISPFNYTGI